MTHPDAPNPEREWVMVPREPTPEMVKAGGNALSPWVAPAMHSAEAYRAMLAAAPVPPTVEGREWMPIESAPKDGTPIVVWTGSRAFLATWLGDANYGKGWIGDGEGWLVNEPTHWMPLPAPPGSEPTPTVEGDDAGLIANLLGPHEWGYRDPVEGGFIKDDTPFRAGEILAALQSRPQPWSPNMPAPDLSEEQRQAYYDLFRLAPGTESWAMAGIPSFEQVAAIFAPGPAALAEVERLRGVLAKIVATCFEPHTVETARAALEADHG